LYNELITYRPIGVVENEFDQPGHGAEMREIVSRIVLDSDLMDGLIGLETGQQLLVLFHFHLSRGFDLLQHPQGDRSRPLRGVFSLRSPRRPNPIGATAVELIEMKDNVLYVKGLDAINGTPVLDIKPA